MGAEPARQLDPAKSLKEGVRLCRVGSWWNGLQVLTELAKRMEKGGNLPGYYYSYLGQAMARCQGRKREGIDLCRHAVRIQPLQPENYLNLAYTYLMVHKRRAAFRAMRKGLAVDPDHRGLLALSERLGMRRRPPIPFLARSRFPNRVIGRLTFWFDRRLTELRHGKADEDDLDLI